MSLNIFLIIFKFKIIYLLNALNIYDDFKITKLLNNN